MKIISLDQMKSISIDDLIELYRDGYRFEEHTSVTSLYDLHMPNFSNINTLQGSLLDPTTNFGKVIVSSCTGGCTVAATEITVDDGAKFPDPATRAFNLVWWNSTDYPDPSDDPNKEIVRCTAKSGNVLTITRAQEGTSASTKNSGGKVYKMILSPTAKMISDISSAITDLAAIYEKTANKGIANGYAGLNASAKVSDATLESPVITHAADVTTLHLPSQIGNSGKYLYTNGTVASWSAPSVVNKTGAYTLTSTDSTVICDATSGAFTITLPTAVGISGMLYNIKKIDATGNAITIATASSQTIDGTITKSLNMRYESITVQSNGTNWYIL